MKRLVEFHVTDVDGEAVVATGLVFARATATVSDVLCYGISSGTFQKFTTFMPQPIGLSFTAAKDLNQGPILLN